MSRLAAFITPGKTIAEAVERVQLAEQLDYETVFTTHIAGHDGMLASAMYAQATTKIKVGTGVLPCFPRHPIALAMEANTLDEISGGRFILGIGPSHRATMEGWFGYSMEKPLSQMREYVEILRAIFSGGAPHRGDFYTANFSFIGVTPRKDLPIWVSALSPNMLRWAGAACDGIILWACMPSYIRSVVVPAVRAGAEAAGRDPSAIEIAAAIPTALTDDVAEAYDAFRKEFWVYMSLPFYRRVIEGAGFGADIVAFDAANADGDFDGALRSIGEDLLRTFSAIGDENIIESKYAEYRAAGVTLPSVGLFRSRSSGVAETLRVVAKVG